MPSAAPQHLAPVIDLLARSLPPTEAPGRSPMNEATLTTPNRFLATLRRAGAAVRSTLALVGVCALAGFTLLPVSVAPDHGLGIGDSFMTPGVVSAGPIQARGEAPLDLEQRAMTEFIANRYRVA